MKIFIVPKYILPFGYGITINKWAIAREDSEDLPYVIAHEVYHVKQIEELGFFKWLYRYFKELYYVGYKDNRFEVEARAYGKEYKHEYKDYK